MSKSYLLPYELEPVVSQELLTGSMKINPYLALDPIRADVAITLDIDRWTEKQTSWLSPVTQTYYQISGGGASTVTQLIGSSSKSVEFMRAVKQSFKIDGFKVDEELVSVKFDGIEIQMEDM